MNRLVILALVLAGGCAALSWEILWQVHASLALGVSAFGTAVTLAATMAGMTIGALAAGRWLRSHPGGHPLRRYGVLELCIGLSGVLMPAGFAGLEHLDAWLYALSPVLTPAFQVAGIAAVLLPPALAMGATVPVFATMARVHGIPVAVLYGTNTAGAALGVLGVSFLVIPGLGLLHTGLLVAGLNGAVFVATRWTAAREQASEEPATPAASGIDLPRAATLVFGTGFVTFGLEVAWFRSLRAAFQSTTESFAIVLASVLAALALGAQLAPVLRRRGFRPATALALAGPAILLATPLVERMDLLSVFGGYAWVLAKWMGTSALLLGPALFTLGLVLPWCLEEFATPSEVGRLYALNTLGAVAGSLVAAWLLLPSLGFAQTAWLLGALVVALALLAGEGRLRFGAAAAGAASLALAIATNSSVGRERIQVQDALKGRSYEILAYREDPDTTVSVVEDSDGDRLLVIDGFVTSTERSASSYMEWMGRLPMLLHPDPKRALVICFGTGQTVRGVRDEDPEAIDVVDVSRSVLSMAGHFRRNRGVLEDPLVRSVVMDGRAWIRREPREYDVVTLEPMAPHFAGTNALYSRDFYERVAERLAPGGVVAQWVPFHLLPPVYAASVVASFQAVFADAALWVDPSRGRTGIVLGRLPGASEPLGSAWPGLLRKPGGRPLPDAKIRGALVLGPDAVARFAALGEPITDDNQHLAYSLLAGELDRLRGRSLELNLRRVAEAAGRLRL